MAKVEGVTLTMELDSGSALTVVLKKDYETHFSSLKLQPTAVMFKTDAGVQITLMGLISENVQRGDQHARPCLDAGRCGQDIR